ncbi:MAG: ATP-binding protein [Chloroflexi bacterium]|nr:ATP-binding protein [Chloroflexota bacterium]MDA0243643.1 ATP-binding protein [Chloroflexota bacterium]
MARDWDQARLQRYIDEAIEESLTLEYKSGEALSAANGRRGEIAKDVSAMANSAGGIIIYGIAEHTERELQHRPAGFAPVNRRECSKETLEQIISSNIQPRLSGIKIYPVPLFHNPLDVAYVVYIPQSDTVHQVTFNNKYYKRFNFEAVPMADYEVRDVLNRGTHPIVEPRIGHITQEWVGDVWQWVVPIFAKNQALVVAKDTAVTIEFLDARPENQITAEKFIIKTQPKPLGHAMYIATFPEAIHKGLNKWFGTFRVTTNGPQSLILKIQVFSNGMRAKWWQVKLNLGERGATIQVLDDDYLY